MSSTVFYRKVGRRYVPVGEYDQDFMDRFPYGASLVTVHKNCTSRRYSIDPDYAAMIAAGIVAEDAISAAVVKASELKPARKELTPAQLAAWKSLSEALGDERCTLQCASARDVARAGVDAMRVEAEKLLEHESVRQAYEHLLMVCALTKTEQNQ